MAIYQSWSTKRCHESDFQDHSTLCFESCLTTSIIDSCRCYRRIDLVNRVVKAVHLRTQRSLRMTHFSPSRTSLPSCSMQSLPIDQHHFPVCVGILTRTYLPCLCSRAIPVSSATETGSTACVVFLPELGKLEG